MNLKSIVSVFFISTICTTLYSQYTEDLLTIINSKNEIARTAQQVDSFFVIHQETIPPKELADCYHEYGKWYYKKWKQKPNKKTINEAILYTKKALLTKEKSSTANKKSLKKTLYNLGVFNSIKRDFFEAINYYQQLIEIDNIDSKTLSTHRALANIYKKTGDFHKALEHLYILIDLSKKDSTQKKKLLQAYLNIIDTYSLMSYKKYSEEIKKYAKKADSLLSLLSIKKTKYYNRIYQAEGNRLLKTHNYREAIINFNKVIKHLPVEDLTNLAIAYNSLGRSYYQLKNQKKALINFQKGINYAPTFTPNYENLGDLYTTNNEFERGLKEYQKAINYKIGNKNYSSSNNLISVEDLNQVSSKYDLLNHLIQKGKAWIAYYHHDTDHNYLLQAINTFRLADKLVDIIRFESTEYKSKLYWRKKASSLYAKAVEACFLLNNPEEAYYFMEKNKAILLLEDITNEQAKENAKLPQKLASREYQLKQNIYLSENKLNSSQNISKDTLSKLKNEISRYKRSYQVFVDSLSILYPDYALNKQKIKVLPYALFTSKYISNQEHVLQYIINKDQGYGILHTNEQPIFFKINTPNKLLENITALHHLLSSRFKNATQQTNYYKKAYQIFEQLLPEAVYSQVKEKNITIIPDHILQNLSFETLITSLETNNYLIKNTEIRYAYSMSYLDQNQQKKRKAIQKIIGIAPVKFNDSSLSSLPYSEKEITGIAALTNNETLLLKEQASKANFIQSANQYQIIHLSTHASIEKDKTPWIAFRNQKMHLPEIYATKNQSEMVVLSACKTSLGELNPGEGVMSLARGFFYAGANSVVSSLWSVNDKANQELMIDFYKDIKQGHTKSTALRNAKLNYINTHDGSEVSPFYWGSLVLIGDNTSIDLSSQTNSIYWYWIAICSIILILLFLKLIYHKIKNSP